MPKISNLLFLRNPIGNFIGALEDQPLYVHPIRVDGEMLRVQSDLL